MELPNEMFFVRHGKSLANHANDLDNAGDSSLFQKLRGVHTSKVPLVETGVEQARRAGAWIRGVRREAPFDKYLMTSYRRGIETAAHLGLPFAKWQTEYALRERDWGDMEHMARKDRDRLWPTHETRIMHTDPYHLAPPGGEAYVDVIHRVFAFLEYMGRTYPGSSIICVGHYESIMCARIVIEHIPEFEFAGRKKSLGLSNCDVLHYERTRMGGFRWRMFDNAQGTVSEWNDVKRRTFSNEELLAMFEPFG